MHAIEPFYNWQHIYTAKTDRLSPFFGTEHSEFVFSQTVYNYLIHPQWDSFGSHTLYIKIIFVDYDTHVAIAELMGEWNDAIENDVMNLKREVIDKLGQQGIHKFVLISENVFNFHSSDSEYYNEWHDEVMDQGGWIVLLNMPTHSKHDFDKLHLHQYMHFLDIENWRTYRPTDLFLKIDAIF